MTMHGLRWNAARYLAVLTAALTLSGCFDGDDGTGSAADGGHRDARVFLHHKNGHRVPVWIRVAPLRDTDGNIVGGAELFTDLSAGNAITEQIQELERLSFSVANRAAPGA